MRKLLLIALLFVAASAFGQIRPGKYRNEYGGEFTITRVYSYIWPVMPLNRPIAHGSIRKEVVGLVIIGSEYIIEYYTVQQINSTMWLLTSVEDRYRSVGNNRYFHQERGIPFWIQYIGEQ